MRFETTLHAEIIAKLVSDTPGTKTKGFAKEVAKLVGELGYDNDCIPSGFVPDAFKIDCDTKTIFIYEVEVEYPLTAHKVEKLGYFWESWDCEESDWLPALILVDRYGFQNEVDLRHAYHLTGPFARFSDAVLSAAPSFTEVNENA